jgi:hypothetical protein
MALFASQASAAVVLDQASVPQTGAISGSASSVGLGGNNLGQSFTVGLAGTLDRIDIGLFKFDGAGEGFTFNVLDASNTVLFSTTVSAASLIFRGLATNYSQLLQVHVGAIAVAPGQVLKWDVVKPPGTTGSLEGLLTSPAYAGGVSYNINGSGFTPNASRDFAFRTYVDTSVAAVPEPGTWSLLILGVGLTGAVARRRRGLAGPLSA